MTGSGMTENTAGCILQGTVGGGQSEGHIAGGGSTADVRPWNRKSREGGFLLAVVVVGGGTGVGKGKNWDGAVRDCVHRTQATTVSNTTTARVLDDCNSPSLGKNVSSRLEKTRETKDTRVTM